MAQGTESAVVEDLVARAAAGDPKAQQEVFARYWGVIRQIVRGCRARYGRHLQLRDQTDDLAQDVALEVLGNLPRQRWQGRAAFRAWLRAMAEAKVIDAQRRHLAQKRDQRRETGASRADLMASAPSPEAKIDLRRRLERLAALLDQLKPEYAGAVMLHHLGYSHAEIGELLGCTAEAARKLVSRAEAKLVRLEAQFDAGRHRDA
ncbi:MAG: sigma-70 family RNA polymerase sigma factor [Deltaproteobacteria bacterium]|nr:sigma-70 family RNA polymerase sigma factor [Deltaproteobacteria bacterium]